jgi:hypothetical protein
VCTPDSDHFENNGKIRKRKMKIRLTDEYLLENWRELAAVGLSEFDETYYKSDSCKLDRGRASAMKEKDKKNSCFICIGKDGTEYKMPNWTDEEFMIMGLLNFFKDDDSSVTDLFDI